MAERSLLNLLATDNIASNFVEEWRFYVPVIGIQFLDPKSDQNGAVYTWVVMVTGQQFEYKLMIKINWTNQKARNDLSKVEN